MKTKDGDSISVENLSKIVNGKLFGSISCNITNAFIDSRKTAIPSNSIFFAIKGKFNDGHKYIKELINKGVSCFVVSKLPSKNIITKANFILVENTINALQNFAQYKRNLYNVPIVGITGSNGKTIVKEWIAQCLSNKFNITRSPASFNSQVGVPLSVLMLSTNTQLGIFEAGISLPNEMARLSKIINPTIGIFTNIGDAHQENFTTIEQKVNEKLKLFSNSEILIFNDNNSIASKIIKNTFPKNKLFSWSFNNEANIKATVNNNNLLINYLNNKIKIKLPVSDNASIENLMHVISLIIYLKIDINEIPELTKNLSTIPMRLELKAGKNNNTIINDSYNSDIGSITNALDYLSQQKQHSSNIVILSDIFQSGYRQKELYIQIANLINSHNINTLIGVGENISEYKDLFKIRDKLFVKNTNECINVLNNINPTDSNILLKGSRVFEFEKIEKKLQQQSHRTILEINLNTIQENLNYFKTLINQETKIIAMVKAFSYGSGTFEIANTLQYLKVSYLATAFTDEGVELRENGITLPIMVMNPSPNEFEELIEKKLEPQISNFDTLIKLNEFLISRGKLNYPIHIKLNTGMNRSGFNESEISKLTEKLLEYKSTYVSTIFSHLAASDEPQHDSFTVEQVACFEQMTQEINCKLNRDIPKHILNSAGIERFPQFQYNFVRLGIGLYGISAINNNKIKQVSRLITYISQIKKVPKGQTIGYSRKGVADKDLKIAILPIGYADGFSRALGNGIGKVSINNNLAPTIGNICMDMTIIDITNIDANIGDEVEIFGNNISVQDIAQKLNTIPYEVLTNVSTRVKRVYIKN